jgi:hypothetical protein
VEVLGMFELVIFLLLGGLLMGVFMWSHGQSSASQQKRILLYLLYKRDDLSPQDLVKISGGELRPQTAEQFLAELEEEEYVTSSEDVDVQNPHTVARRYRITVSGRSAIDL